MPVTSEYSLSFRIADQVRLRSIETAFIDALVSTEITRKSLDRFLRDSRTQGLGSEYASGLAEYCLGIILKERPEGERLTTPLSRYRESYGSALEILGDIRRPLAYLITCIIRFSMNDFGYSGRRTGYFKLDSATELLLNPSSCASSIVATGAQRHPICPIDHGTGRVLELASHLAEQPRWSPILDDECRRLAHSELLDVTDQQKIFAIWAASAWRVGTREKAYEPLTQIAEVYPFSQWASKLLNQLPL